MKIYSPAITSMICVQMRPECWTSQGNLSCSPWKSVCHRCHSYRCHTLLYARQWDYISHYRKIVDLCVWSLCGISSWNSHVWWFLGMKELLDLLQRCWVGKAGCIPWPGRWCEFTLLDSVFWDYVTEHIVDHLAFCWWKDTLQLNIFWDLLSSGIVHSIKW